ncbi:hypothetical protein YO5_17165 [Stutzerimonas stutzeri TS44]|nr:hypothetical protein YO5_17165 [Stutzerimonas stutzeri TS44]
MLTVDWSTANDIVTTMAYIPEDVLALGLVGNSRLCLAAGLLDFAQQ